MNRDSGEWDQCSATILHCTAAEYPSTHSRPFAAKSPDSTKVVQKKVATLKSLYNSC